VSERNGPGAQRGAGPCAQRRGANWAQGLLALGANLGQPEQQLRGAIAALRRQGRLEVCWVSPWMRTTAEGCSQEQPDYLNGVLCFASPESPEYLLGLCHGLEARAGRDRLAEGFRGARRLDLDLLCLGSEQRSRPGLTLPHPRFEERVFVLAPLCSADPQWRLPSGRTAREALAELLARGDAGGERALPKPKTPGSRPSGS
jgi:2-amino-4-hydroxy-6-hydroxymethyldihydropteridine diphosphokinase